MEAEALGAERRGGGPVTTVKDRLQSQASGQDAMIGESLPDGL
jgi:hypothetical protein